MYGKLPVLSMLTGRSIKIRTKDGFTNAISLGEFRPQQFDVWNIGTQTIEERHAVMLKSDPMLFPNKNEDYYQVAVLTTKQTLRLPYNYPGVSDKVQKEFEQLVDMECFMKIPIEKMNPDKVVDVILIPTLKENKGVKVCVGLRGDTIKNIELDTSAELRILPLRMIHLIKLLSYKNIGATDVKKAYYQTPYEGNILLRLPKRVT